jgi:hypothetical protein
MSSHIVTRLYTVLLKWRGRYSVAGGTLYVRYPDDMINHLSDFDGILNRYVVEVIDEW